MRKEEFEAGYCERSKITREFYREHFVSLPCACGESGCEGWAKISLEEHRMLHHLAFNLPENERLHEMEEEALLAEDERRSLRRGGEHG